MLLAVVGFVLVAVAAGVVTALVVGNDSGDNVAATATTAPVVSPSTLAAEGSGAAEAPSTTAPVASTVPAAPTTVATAPPAPPPTLSSELRAVAERLQVVLGQSAQGRDEVVEVVRLVESCAIQPYDAETRMERVMSNRQDLLTQLSAMAYADDATANDLVNKLQAAIGESLTSNRHYLAWISGDYRTAYWAPGGCRVAPRGIEYEEATAASGRATTAKREFADAYNPVAADLGLRQWQHTEF